MDADVILAGASTRAAAFSALRAGLKPTCADLFADLDLADCCKVAKIPGDEYPAGLEFALGAAALGPWAYVGALENHPELVERIARRRPLWGNGREVLQRVRDPFQVAACLARTRLPCPRVQRSGDTPAPGESWLVKPLAGAGGRGVREYTVRHDMKEYSARKHLREYSALSTQHSDIETGSLIPRGHYLQQRIDGMATAAVFVADGRRARFLGLTQQLVGEPALHAKPFHYCGSVGPLEISPRLDECCRALGDALTGEFDLIGLFGVDAICRNDELWPVEVNPRYTASMEIVEHWRGVPLMSLHRDACVRGIIPEGFPLAIDGSPDNCRQVLGKAVLFAPETFTTPDTTKWARRPLACSGRWPLPCIADIPRPGIEIVAGQPICTVFAVQSSVEACRQALFEAGRDLYSKCMPV